MWLGAMDTRIAATLSSGYITTMDQAETSSCHCWKFEGLRDLVDWADVYAMIAPRPLQCQCGSKDRQHGRSMVPFADQAMLEIRPAYADFGAQNNLELCIHAGGHEMDVPAMLAFFEQRLK